VSAPIFDELQRLLVCTTDLDRLLKLRIELRHRERLPALRNGEKKAREIITGCKRIMQIRDDWMTGTKGA
jgi:hypothetical protein